MIELIIFTGNIGCGKSTKAKEFANKDYVIINMDDIVSMIGAGNYMLYDIHKKPIYKHIEASAITTSLMEGFSVVVDKTGINRKMRSRYIDLVKNISNIPIKLISYDWGKGTSRCINNRCNDLRGYSREYWEKVYDKFFNMYEQPSFNEGFNEMITVDIGGDCKWIF